MENGAEPVGSPDVDPLPPDGGADRGGGGGQRRDEWVRTNFTQIFGVSAEDLRAQGINPRQYATAHRDQIRQFAQRQRRQGILVPSGRSPGARGPGDGATRAPLRRGYGYPGGQRFGLGVRGGSAWIGVLLALFALRFLLVDSFAGTHAAVYWVLGIGGIMLVARVVLFSWLRRRRYRRRSSGGAPRDASRI